jgi:hypothetical protein
MTSGSMPTASGGLKIKDFLFQNSIRIFYSLCLRAVAGVKRNLTMGYYARNLLAKILSAPLLYFRELGLDLKSSR